MPDAFDRDVRLFAYRHFLAAMLASRSEEHVERWCRIRRVPRGAVFSLEQAWQLGRAWYANKLTPDWRRATPNEAEATFAEIGLTGDFWRLRAR